MAVVRYISPPVIQSVRSFHSPIVIPILSPFPFIEASLPPRPSTQNTQNNPSNSSTMAPKPQLHVAIVGAGLGGLAAAISISLAGHRATILEQASELGEVMPLPFVSLQTTNLLLSRSEPASKSPQTLRTYYGNLVSSRKSKPSPRHQTPSCSALTRTAAYSPHNPPSLTVKKRTARHTYTYTGRTTIVSWYRGLVNLGYRSSWVQE